MEEETYGKLMLIGCLIVTVISLLWMKWQWSLCRNEGFDFWYCVQHIL